MGQGPVGRAAALCPAVLLPGGAAGGQGRPCPLGPRPPGPWESRCALRKGHGEGPSFHPGAQERLPGRSHPSDVLGGIAVGEPWDVLGGAWPSREGEGSRWRTPTMTNVLLQRCLWGLREPRQALPAPLQGRGSARQVLARLWVWPCPLEGTAAPPWAHAAPSAQGREVAPP